MRAYKKIQAFIIPCMFVLLWSSGYISVESGLRDNSPLVFLSLRFIFTCVLLSLFILYVSPKPNIEIKQILLMGVTGIFLQGFYLGFFFLALNNHVSPGILAIILGLQPLMLFLVMKEKMHFLQIIGLILGIMGLAITTVNTITVGTITPIGILFSFLSLLGITIGTLLQKKYCSEFPLIFNMAVQYFFSALLITAISLVFEKTTINWTWSFVASLSWVVVVMSIMTFFLFYTLLKQGEASKVTSFLYCVPAVTAIMDYLMFKHVISKITICGMFLVMLSIALIHKKHNKSLDKYESN